MGNRLSKIYTRTGDDGTTGLGDGNRVDKTSARVSAMGDVDELNCIIGILLIEDLDEELSNRLIKIQHALFDLGGEISIPGYQLITEEDVAELENYIDQYNELLPPLKDFILPGGNKAASLCHYARAVCRRAERCILSLAQEESINAHGKIYLNRLSDFLFVTARILSRRDGGTEVYWDKKRREKGD